MLHKTGWTLKNEMSYLMANKNNKLMVWLLSDNSKQYHIFFFKKIIFASSTFILKFLFLEWFIGRGSM